MLAATIVSVASILLVPWFIARIPSNYFLGPHPPPLPWAESHPLLRVTLTGVKNVLGALLVVAGVAMLVLPGQGILTLLIGGMLLDFPGKRALELRLLRMERLKRLLDWIRAKAGRGPLEVGDDPGFGLHSGDARVDPTGRDDDE